jgi:membrane-associated phospholipid phosphatase
MDSQNITNNSLFVTGIDSFVPQPLLGASDIFPSVANGAFLPTNEIDILNNFGSSALRSSGTPIQLLVSEINSPTTVGLGNAIAGLPKSTLPSLNLISQSLTSSTPVTTPSQPNLPFVIQAGGVVKFKEESDLDGNPLDLSDDALVYAAKGFSLTDSSILPVQRDSSGNPLRDGQHKLVLIDRAFVVGSTDARVYVSDNSRYANLDRPQVLAQPLLVVPNFAQIEQLQLADRIPVGTAVFTFNSQQNPTNNLKQWQKFPTPGTVTQPKVVRVTGGGLNIPAGIDLSNYVIIVDNGNITCNDNAKLTNVTLVANNGSINLNRLQGENVAVLAAGKITTSDTVKLGGNSLLANGSGDITFNGRTCGTNTLQNLQVISQGRITFNDVAILRGSFLSAGEFITNDRTELSGTIASQKDIIFNDRISVTYVDLVAPVIAAGLANDTGRSNTDKLTNDATIAGKIADTSKIATFKAGFDTTPAGSWQNVTTSLQPGGAFSFSRTQLDSIAGGTLADGTHILHLSAIDKNGNQSSFDYTFTLDTKIVIPTLQLVTASDTGTSTIDRLTKINTPTLTGTGESGATIQLRDGLQSIGQTTVGADGKWQLTASPLSDGNHHLTAIATDIAGNVSSTPTALEIAIDTVAPQVQLAQELAGIVLNWSSHFAGQVVDSNIATLSYQFNGAAATQLTPTPSGTFSFDSLFDFTGVNDGTHDLTIVATDLVGNSVSHTYAVTIACGPLLSIGLLNDTGIDNNDGITSDLNVRGRVAEKQRIARLEFALDGTSNYIDLTTALQADGSFQLLPTQLDLIAGGQLSFGTHSLIARGVSASGVPVGVTTLNFNCQAANTNRASLVLAKSSDTGVGGDLVTSANLVDLVAKTQAGLRVKLGELTAIADATGTATFTGVALAFGANQFTVNTIDANGEIATSNTTIVRTNPDDVILTWNHVALNAIATAKTPPPAAARILAMVHTAMYDAANAVEQKYAEYHFTGTPIAGADEIAAAAEAAAKILSAFYPTQQAYFDAVLANSLLDGATASATAAGIALGDAVAASTLAWRQTDGATATVTYTPGTIPGDWLPDLPTFATALLPQWGNVTPFGLTTGSQFRPTGASSLTSTEYTQAFNETKAYGAKNSSLRTAEQTQIALFWADGGGTFTPPGHWNDIAATAASITGKNVLDNARIFAVLNIALADAGIAAWDAKYTYNTWRPITAIRQADLDGNADTIADATWLPLIATPPFPEYVSGHSTFSAAAATVLDRAFGSNFSFNTGSNGLPDVTRSFTGFDAAAAEAGQSRIYGGIHFQFANQDGLTLGQKIGAYVIDRFTL